MAQTTHQKLAALKAQATKLADEIASLQAKADAEVNPDLVQAGVVVTFNYGKGDTKKIVTGAVVGRRDPAAGEKGGSFVKVASGEGFDAVIYTIAVSAVTAIQAPASVETPAEGEAQAS